MRDFQRYIGVAVIALALIVGGCPKRTESSSNEHAHSHEGESGEHDRDAHEHHGDAGEESGTELALDQTYNATRNGAQLYLAYNKQSNAFEGWVKNNTRDTLEQVRVEIHLSNGKEIGPTAPEDLAPGQQIDVQLAATSTDFTGWTAHPEVGCEEHSHEGHDHEHGEHGHEH